MVVSFNAAKISKGLKKFKKTPKCLKKLKRPEKGRGEPRVCWCCVPAEYHQVEAVTGSSERDELWEPTRLLLSALFAEKRQEEKKDTFVEKLATQVIKNLQVKISSIHLRYEDDVSSEEAQHDLNMTFRRRRLRQR